MVRMTSIVAALVVGLVAVPTLRAADTEVRIFKVSVDGKESGKYAMTFTKEADGTLTIDCDAHVKVKVAFVTAYHYDYTGREVWKDGRLVSLDSTADDDGKKFKVSARAGNRGLTVKVNNDDKTISADSYLTTACCPPDAARRDGDLPLMEADDGQEIKGKIQQLGTESLNVAGHVINVSHARLKSLIDHDVWYDGTERMVRQEWTEGGHKTVLELTNIKR